MTTPNKETWVEGEYRFTRLESRHVVADPLVICYSAVPLAGYGQSLE
jgi:hypothetical protein